MSPAEKTAPLCPRCACRHCWLVAVRDLFEPGRAVYTCRACGTVFRAPYAPAVERKPTYVYRYTPNCGLCGGKLAVTSSRTTYRYLRCQQCGRSVKQSAEEV